MKVVNGGITIRDLSDMVGKSLSEKLKFFWINSTGVHAAGGKETSGIPFDPSVESTYGFNMLLNPSSLSLRYDNTDIIKMSGNTSIPSIDFYNLSSNTSDPANGKKIMSLDGQALKFYKYDGSINNEIAKFSDSIRLGVDDEGKGYLLLNDAGIFGYNTEHENYFRVGTYSFGEGKVTELLDSYEIVDQDNYPQTYTFNVNISKYTQLYDIAAQSFYLSYNQDYVIQQNNPLLYQVAYTDTTLTVNCNLTNINDYLVNSGYGLFDGDTLDLMISYDKDLSTTSLSFGKYAGIYDSNNFPGFLSSSFGINTLAKGEYSIAGGARSRSEGMCSLAMGNRAYSIGTCSFAMGLSSRAEGDFAISVGSQTKATGYCSFAANLSTTAKYYASTALGYGTTAVGVGQLAIGMFNKPDTIERFIPDDEYDNLGRGHYSFIIGGGYKGYNVIPSYENELTIDWDGNVWHKGDGEHIFTSSEIKTTSSSTNIGQGVLQGDQWVVKYGKVVQIAINFTCGATGAGENCIEGTISNTDYLPILGAMGSGYFGSHSLVLLVRADGTFAIRNASPSTVTCTSNTTIRATYITA